MIGELGMIRFTETSYPGMSSDIGFYPASRGTTDEDRYRRDAKFCREQSLLLRGPEARRWAYFADEYERLADGRV